MAVVIETTLGDLTVDLFIQERPKACLNFLKLCKLKYYNFNLFHNVEHGFIAQTGDPTGAGDGGESVWGVVEGPHKRYFEGESLPKIRHSEPGLVSMVSVGKNMIGSQFFFTLGPDLYSLDGVHCVIGEVAEGHEVLRKLNEAIVDEKFRPYQDIRITHTVILEDPFDDPRGFQIPSRSPSPTPERLKNGRIGADEDIDDTEGKSIQEIQEMLQEREAKARATILEIVGDLPDADIAPPENVLFVCKLNPVTNDDDLEIIFSRFGKVKCCEVIRDKITGDSLQYAFVEFEDKKSCEQAYFKMDNVLIDDRRIHVDFSQSVAKVRWRGKGRGVVHENKNSNGRLDFNNLRGSKKEKGNFDRRDVRDNNGNPGPSSRKEYPERRRYDDRRPNNDNREKHENNDRRSNRDDRGRFDRQEVRRPNRDDKSSVERSNHRRPNKDNLKDDRERFARDDERKSHRDDRDRLEKNDDRSRNRDYRKDDNAKERGDRQRFERSDRNFDREMRGADRSSNVRGENDRGRRNEERPGPSQDTRNRDRERYRDDRDRDRREDRRQDEYHHRRREDSRSPIRERVERKKSPEKRLKREPTPEHKHSSKEVSKKRLTEEISKKVKKHRKKSDTSDSDSSSSSDSDKQKRKKKKKTKKRRRKKKRSSSSSSSSSD